MKDTSSREKIFKTSLLLFANKGYDSVTIRDIVKTAGVNISLVNYYFRSKKQLYTDLIYYIISIIIKDADKYCGFLKYIYFFDDECDKNRQKLFSNKYNQKEFEKYKSFFLQEIRDKDSQTDIFTDGKMDCRKLNRNELERLFIMFFQMFTREIFINRHIEISSIIIRETTKPTFAYAILYDNIIYPFHILISKLLSSIINVPQNDKRILMLLQTFVGQTAIFMVNRQFNYNILGVKKYSKKIVKDIIDMVTNNIKLILKNNIE